MKSVKITKFLNDKLRPYSSQSNVRGIPFIGDGFKEVQRKALWGIITRGENKDADSVERIAAYACSVTDYHHGANSMEDAIAKMAQRFPGSNNLPVLEANGQFGNRKNFKPSAPRYIKTKLDENFRKVFSKDDDCLIEQLHTGDLAIEPKYFIPIMPLILINGGDGIGTGHACEILQYKPADISSAIKTILMGEELKKNSLVPWFGNEFKGKILKDPITGQVEHFGVWTFSKKGKSHFLTITELPIGSQGDTYKKHLDELETDGVILDYDNLSDKTGFEFIIKVPAEMVEWPEVKILKVFKLVGRTTENFTVWGPDGKLIRYDCAEDLLMDWVAWRLDQYVNRFQTQLKNLQDDKSKAEEKKKWIALYLSNVTFFRDNETDVITKFMKENGLQNIDYLLSIPMRALTKAKIVELGEQIVEIQNKINFVSSLDEISVMINETKKVT